MNRLFESAVLCYYLIVDALSQQLFLNYRCVALYEMHQVRRPKVQGPDVKLALFLFVAFGIGFPIVYLRWRYPMILFVCCTHKSSFFVLFDKIQCILDSSHR